MRKELWLGALAALGLLDWYCAYVKHEGTLSQCGRELFHTDTVPGKVAWVGFWGVLSAWILPHIWHWPKDIADKIS